MSTPTAAQLLAMANVQMAAEARLDRFGNQATVAALRYGNNRSSKFSPVQAQAFAQEWSVVDHMANTSTGFSGTLFRYLGASDPARGLLKKSQRDRTQCACSTRQPQQVGNRFGAFRV
jgi:hypothetical protein